MKWEFRHAAPNGKACTARVGVQDLEKPVEDDKRLQRGQGPNLVGLDALCDPSDRRNAVEDRISTVEGSMTTLKAKLDLILGKFKSTHVKDVDPDEDVVGEWTKDIQEAWSEFKPKGRATNKPTKPCKKPRARSSSSSSSASSTDQKEGETKYFERKRFAPKDHKFKRAAEIVHVCVKTLKKVVNEGGDPIPSLRRFQVMMKPLGLGYL